MAAAGKTDGKKYYVTVATSARQVDMINVEYEHFTQYVDWINIMTYIFHVPNMHYHASNHNTGLYSSPNDPSPEPSKSRDNVAGAVQTLIDHGVPKEKIIIGLLTSAKSWAGVTSPPFDKNYTGSAFEGKGDLLSW